MTHFSFDSYYDLREADEHFEALAENFFKRMLYGRPPEKDAADKWSDAEEWRRKMNPNQPTPPPAPQDPEPYKLPGQVDFDALPYDQQVKVRATRWEMMQRMKAAQARAVEPEADVAADPQDAEPAPNTGVSRKEKTAAQKQVFDVITRIVHDPKRPTLSDDGYMSELESAPELADIVRRFGGVADKVVSRRTLKGYIGKARNSFGARPQLYGGAKKAAPAAQPNLYTR